MTGKIHITVFIIILFLLSSSGCGGKSLQENSIQVLTSTSILFDIVQQVGGDYVEISSLIPVGSDPHDFSPQPKDAIKIASAHIIFINGAGLEDNLLPLIDSASGIHKFIEVSEGVEILYSPGKDGGTHYPDPHTWMYPGNILTWLSNITDALIEIDPKHIDEYQKNAADYSFQIMELDSWVRSQVELIPDDRRMIVSDHFVFGYFNKAYGFTQIGTITGSSSTEASPSAQDIAHLEEIIELNKIPAIFISESSSLTLANQIAYDTGIEVVQLFHGSLSVESGPASTYLDFIRYNVTAIVEALR